MKGHGPKHERETIIRLNEEGDTASIWTASESIYRQLLKRGYRPSEDGDRHAAFEIPKREVKLPRPTKKRVLSQKQVEALRKGGFSRDHREESGANDPNSAGTQVGEA